MFSVLASVGHILLIALTFLLIFSALIILHELGHFFVARWAGVKVEEFGFGLPPKIWGKKSQYRFFHRNAKGKKELQTETMEWTLNAIPFGGFVRMLGEESGPEAQKDPRAYCNRPLLWRMAIALAGVTMNFLFALVLFTLVGWWGFSPLIDPNLSVLPRFQSYFSDGHVQQWVDKGFYAEGTNGIFLLAVDPSSPAGKAGLTSGDQILSVNKVGVSTAEEVAAEQQKESAAPLQYTIRHFDDAQKIFTEKEIAVEPTVAEDGKKYIGVVLTDHFYYPLKKVQLGFLEAPKEALTQSKGLIVISLDMVKTVVQSTFGRISQLKAPQIPEGVGGPVAIVDSTRQLVDIGDVSKILQFTALLSLSLAVLNLMPFPALDGGRIIFQLLEGFLFLFFWPLRKIFPKHHFPAKVPGTWENAIHVAGYAILIVFILAVTVKDFGRIFS